MAQATDELIPTRTTLLHRLKDWQDESSWQDFFDTYWKLIYGVAIKAGLTESEAHDVVQETMIAVARHITAFKYNRDTGSFKGWLLNMTRWRISDQLRKREPTVAHESVSDADVLLDTSTLERMAGPANSDIEALWDAEWEKNLLHAAMGRVKRCIDPQKYQIFDFCVNKEWSSEKIATAFGIPVGQVYLAKHRVTEMVKEEVERLKTKLI